jgi:hypothetical protein
VNMDDRCKHTIHCARNTIQSRTSSRTRWSSTEPARAER